MDMKNQEEISDTLTLKLSELTKIIEPPYAEEIERAVLGALMVDPNALNCTGEIKLPFDKGNGYFSNLSMTEAYVPDTLPTMNEDTEATVSDPMQVDLPF